MLELDMEATMEQAQRLATVRKLLGLTQRELAETLGFRLNYIGKLECGAQKISQQFCKRLCLVYPKVNRTFVLQGIGEPLLPEPPETEESRREKLIGSITEVLAALDEPARQVIFESIRRYQKNAPAAPPEPEPSQKKQK